MKRVVILGAGFGGLELAARLHELAPGEFEVTLVERRDFFVVGFAKIDVLFGRRTAEQVKSHYRHLADTGAKLHTERVLSIDPVAKRVVTGSGTLEADVLVVALGADVDATATPGLLEAGEDFYTLVGAEKAGRALAACTGGTVLVSILGAPYKCPPAPFEVALQLHDFFQKRGLREKVAIRVLSPAPTPLPVSKEGSLVLLALMAERGIVFSPNTLVTSLEPATKTAVTKSGERIAFDLFLGVPLHHVPRPVAESGLAAPGGWVAVDAQTMETRFENVYAVGDVTGIPVGQGAVPKAGAFADRAARAVADDIVGKLRGTGVRGKFDGVGTCYLEFGAGKVAKIEANYFGGEKPVVNFVEPSPEFLPQKTAFAEDRLRRWFKPG